MEVSIRTTAEVIDYAITARVVIRYSAHRPYEVLMRIGEGDDPIEWVIGRELLRDGIWSTLTSRVGQGNVQVWRSATQPYRAMIRLRGPEGQAVLALPWEDVARLVQRAYRLVPRGQESRHLDVDRAIRALLGGVA